MERLAAEAKAEQMQQQ